MADEEEDLLTPLMFQLAKYGEALEFQEKVEEQPEDKQYDVQKKDREGYTVLHWACRNGHTRMTEYLISIHANKTATDNNGECHHEPWDHGRDRNLQ
jgi:ankyrin repeat protein